MKSRGAETMLRVEKMLRDGTLGSGCRILLMWKVGDGNDWYFVGVVGWITGSKLSISLSRLISWSQILPLDLDSNSTTQKIHIVCTARRRKWFQIQGWLIVTTMILSKQGNLVLHWPGGVITQSSMTHLSLMTKMVSWAVCLGTSLWKGWDSGLTTSIYCTVTSNQLTIPSLARHHLLSIFTCQAINNNITVPSATSITLDLNRECCLFDSWFKLFSTLCSIPSFSLCTPLNPWIYFFPHFRLFFHPSFSRLMLSTHRSIPLWNHLSLNHGFGKTQWNRLKWKSVNSHKFWWRIRKQFSNVQLSDPDQRLLFIGTSMARDLTLRSMVLYQHCFFPTSAFSSLHPQETTIILLLLFSQHPPIIHPSLLLTSPLTHLLSH